MFKKQLTIKFDSPNAKGKYIVTGGPGFGITTIINELRSMFIAVKREAARYIIEQERKKINGILPWTNREAFDKILQEQKIVDYASVDTEICFFDRGLPDFVGWRNYLKMDFNKFIHAIEEYAYEKNVFMTVPWREIFKKEENRPFDYEIYESIHYYLKQAYEELGYNVILIPKGTPRHRARFILNQLHL